MVPSEQLLDYMGVLFSVFGWVLGTVANAGSTDPLVLMVVVSSLQFGLATIALFLLARLFLFLDEPVRGARQVLLFGMLSAGFLGVAMLALLVVICSSPNAPDGLFGLVQWMFRAYGIPVLAAWVGYVLGLLLHAVFPARR